MAAPGEMRRASLCRFSWDCQLSLHAIALLEASFGLYSDYVLMILHSPYEAGVLGLYS